MRTSACFVVLCALAGCGTDNPAAPTPGAPADDGGAASSDGGVADAAPRCVPLDAQPELPPLGQRRCMGRAAGKTWDPFAAGPFPVGVTTITIADPLRPDRSLTTEVWYPADASAKGRPGVAYTAKIADLAKMGGVDIPIPGDITLVTTDAVHDAPRAPADPAAGLVVFSHGFRGIRWQSTFLTIFLASHGYVVAAPDHVGNTIFDGSASAEQSATDRIQDMALVTSDMVTRARSTSDFFAGAFDPLRVAWTGHSFGASTDIMAGAFDNREIVNLPLAPAFDDRMGFVYRPASYDLRAATFIFGGTADTTCTPPNQKLAYDRTVAPRHLVMLDGVQHMDFTDLCANDTLRLIPQFGKNCGPSTKQAQATTRSLVAAALHRYLRCDPRADAWLTPASVGARAGVASYEVDVGAPAPAADPAACDPVAGAAVAHEERTLVRDGAPALHVAIDGPNDAPPLVFVHGLGTTGAVWDRQARALAGRYRVVRVDLRGHGASAADPSAPFGPDGAPGTADDPYRLEAYARDIADTIGALGLSRPVIVGWSSGAQAAAMFALGPNASQLRGLVLVGFTPLTAPDVALHPDYSGGGTLAFARDVRLAALDPPAATWSPVVERFFAAPPPASLVSEFLGRMSDVPVATRRGQLGSRPDLVDALASIVVPTLVLHGEQDDAVLLESARFAAGAIPGAKLTIFQRSGHAPFAEEPARFDDAVAAFVDQLAP